MKATKQDTQISVANQTPVEQTVEVLYQKMGDKWFAFSMVGDEVYVGSVTQAELDLGPIAKMPSGNA